MSPTRPVSALAVIDRLTPQLAAHNTGEHTLSDDELQDVLMKLRTANVAVGECLCPPRRRRKSSDNDVSELEKYIQIFAAAGLISFFIILFGILLHGMFQMMAMSMTVHPGP